VLDIKLNNEYFNIKLNNEYFNIKLIY